MDAQRSQMRREADERREVAARRDAQRRADSRRVGVRRTTMTMEVSRERRELSEFRTSRRRIARDQRNPESRRQGARRERIESQVI